MRADTVFKFTYTFDRYIPVKNGDVTSWVRNEAGLRGMLIPMSGGSFNLLCKNPMRPGDSVRGLTDRAGTLVFAVDGTDREMFVQHAGPQVDGFGRVIGYLHSLKATLPRDIASEIIAVIGG